MSESLVGKPDAYDVGYDAYFDDTECPFDPGSFDYIEWWAGYGDAANDEEEEWEYLYDEEGED